MTAHAKTRPRLSPSLDHSRSAFHWVFAACCGLSLLPLWTTTYPPMVDLPQHAAQVSTWHRWDAADFDYSEFYWINRATPYLVSNTLAYLLSFFVPVLTAFKLVLSAALVGLPLATLALVRAVGGRREWALLTLPLAYGFAFYMGFVAFVLATPLALLVLLAAWRFVNQPSLRRGWIVFGLLQLLFFTHVILFGWAGLVGALVAAARAPDARAVLRRWTPFLGAAILPFTWIALTSQIDSTTQTEAAGFFDWQRVTDLPALLVGLEGKDWVGIDWAMALGVWLLVTPFLTGGRPGRDRVRWIPVATTVVLYLASPWYAFGTDFVQPRFAILLLPTLLFALDHAPTPRSSRWPTLRWPTLLLAAPSVAWALYLTTLFHLVEVETGALAEVLDDAPPNARILYLPVDRNSRFLPYPVYLHSGVWYQVAKGGLVDFSFAEFFPNRYRYHRDKVPPLPFRVEWRPHLFDWHEHGGELYDFLLIRSDDGAGFVRRLRAPLLPVAEGDGGWSLWARATTRAPEASTTDPK